MIPEHVAAYAAGLRDCSKARGRAMSWAQIARVVELMGLGRFGPADLEAAAVGWSIANIDPGALRWLAKKGTPHDSAASRRKP